MESKFENTKNKIGSQSAVDITALDVQMQDITQKMQKTTEAYSSEAGNEEHKEVSSALYLNSTCTNTTVSTTSTSKVQSFV